MPASTATLIIRKIDPEMKRVLQIKAAEAGFTALAPYLRRVLMEVAAGHRPFLTDGPQSEQA